MTTASRAISEFLNLVNGNAILVDEHIIPEDSGSVWLDDLTSNASIGRFLDLVHQNLPESDDYTPEILEHSVSNKGHELSNTVITPTFLRGETNDYSSIEAAIDEHYKPERKVSIVIPTYNRKGVLEKNLAALVQQNYPHNLMEVVIADDGSSDGTQEMVRNMDLPFDVKYIWQADKGYRVAKARNEGIKRAAHETIITLDVDRIPTSNLVREHMKWHHTAQNVGVIGIAKYVKPEDVPLETILSEPEKLQGIDSPRTSLNIEWKFLQFEPSSRLKNAAEPFRYTVTGNLSFNKRTAFLAGLYDEDFSNFWGGEDKEFGHRLYQSGTFLVPNLDAIALHLEHPVPKSRMGEEYERAQRIFNDKIESFEQYSFPAPKVSIYMPAYNRENYIKEAIESAVNQTFQDLEIVVCDDGSTDRTPEILKELQAKYNKQGERPLIRVIKHDTNKGIAAGWNSALRIARGMYFLHLDSDDTLESEATKKLSDVLDGDDDIVLVYGNMDYVDSAGNFYQPGHMKPGDFDRKRHLNVAMSAHHPKLFRADAWFRTEGANEGIQNAVDYDAMIKIVEQGNAHHLEEVLYNYRWHGKQTSQERNDLQQRNALLVQENGRQRRSNVPQKTFYVAKG